MGRRGTGNMSGGNSRVQMGRKGQETNPNQWQKKHLSENKADEKGHDRNRNPYARTCASRWEEMGRGTNRNPVHTLDGQVEIVAKVSKLGKCRCETDNKDVIRKLRPGFL